ncbi:MAG: ATP-binding protein [Balneolales bacterium]
MLTELQLSCYKELLEGHPVGHIIIHLEDLNVTGSFRQVFVNQAACQAAKVDLKKGNNQLWSEAFPELAVSEIAKKLAQVATTGKLLEFETVYEDSLFPEAYWKGSAWLIGDRLVSISFKTSSPNHTSDLTNDQKYEASERKAIQSKNDLDTINEELLAFTYSVSHDLRAPLRRLDGFSQELINSYSDKLDDTGQHYLRRIRKSAQNMGRLIDDLLKLSRISRQDLVIENVDLGILSHEIISELRETDPDRVVNFSAQGSLIARADSGLARMVLFNLLTNAWKFSLYQKSAQIELGSIHIDDVQVFYIKDNGSGFNMAYVDKLFNAFQRLHSAKDYEGTGIGLATVKRIINRHRGKVWAESKPGEGSTFYFTFNGNNIYDTNRY